MLFDEYVPSNAQRGEHVAGMTAVVPGHHHRVHRQVVNRSLRIGGGALRTGAPAVVHSGDAGGKDGAPFGACLSQRRDQHAARVVPGADYRQN